MKIAIDGKTYTTLRNLSFAPECDVASFSLPVNEFSADILTEDSPVGMVGQMVALYDDLGQLWANYWCTFAERVDAQILQIKGQSKLSLLDRKTASAKMYSDATVGDELTTLLTSGMGADSFEIASSVANKTFSGFCPKQTIRERVLNICLACGLVVNSCFADKIQVTEIDETETQVPLEETYWRPTVNYRDPVTAVRATAYGFTEGAPQQGDRTVEANGHTYIVTAQEVTLSNPEVPVTAAENVVEVSDCMLITTTNVDDVLSHLAKYSFPRGRVELECINNRSYSPGQKLTVHTDDVMLYTGYAQRFNFSFGVQAKSAIELTACDSVAGAKLTVKYIWDGVNLGKRVYVFPVGYQYSIENPYLDKQINKHRYIFRPTTEAVTGTMTAQGATVTVQYATALDLYKKNGKRVLYIISVDKLTTETFEEDGVTKTKVVIS